MPSDRNRQFIDFEKPIKDLLEEIEDLKQKAEKSKVDYSEVIHKLESSVLEKRKEINQSLSSWQRVQLSRHPDRPYTLKYITKMTS
ncbi:MAG: acetyl-CoA carboxylase carboxyl transferase subunit alpha, partial [Chitinophagaceae bacterium]